MTAPRRLHKTDVLWMTLVVAILGLHFWFPPLRSGLLNDTWSTSANGKKAFYLLTEAQRHTVSRNTEPFARYVSTLEYWGDYDLLLCVLGASRAPSEQEWSALLKWVRNGGKLLYAVPLDARSFEIPELDLRTISLDGDESPEFVRPADPRLTLGDLETNIDARDDRYDWRTTHELSGPAAEPLLIWNDTIQAVQQPYGRGRIVVVASDRPFSNEALAFGDNHLLVWRLLESLGETHDVVFDESLNASGTPKMLAILLDPLFRPLTLQIVLLVGLYAWWQSRRFGPFLPESTKPRRNIVDHTDNVGNLYFQQKNGRTPLKVYLQQLVAELHLREHRGRERRILAPIALRMGLPVDEVLGILQEAAAAIRQPRVDRRTSARLIARLAQVRQAGVRN